MLIEKFYGAWKKKKLWDVEKFNKKKERAKTLTIHKVDGAKNYEMLFWSKIEQGQKRKFTWHSELF